MSVEALFITAIVLILLEVFIPSLGLLTFGGFVAFSTGIIILFMSDATDFYGLSFEVVAAIGLLIFITYVILGYYVLKIYKRKTTTGVEAMIGQQVMVIAWTGNKGRIEFEGEAWKAVGEGDIQSGDAVTITDMNKMTLTVLKEVK